MARLRRAIIAAPARRITFVDAAAGAVLPLRGADVAAAHATRARALVEVAVDGRRGALDYGRCWACGDRAERQCSEEDGDGLVAHRDGAERRGVSGCVAMERGWEGELTGGG